MTANILDELDAKLKSIGKAQTWRDLSVLQYEFVQAVVAKARAEEREACAKIADDNALGYWSGDYDAGAASASENIARLIREREKEATRARDGNQA